jgi:hypothetical protein
MAEGGTRFPESEKARKQRRARWLQALAAFAD